MVSMGRFNWIYDPAGRLVDLKYTKPDGTVISDFAYTHDDAGNIRSKTTDFGLIQYGYDALDRLVLADYDWKADEFFNYDPVGNRISTADNDLWVYDSANQLLGYGTGGELSFTFQYDSNGSVLSMSDNITDTVDYYSYNNEDRMSGFHQSNGTIGASYCFDSSNQRIKKEIHENGSLLSCTWFLYGNEGLLAEYSSNQVMLKKYLWHPDHQWGTNPLWQRDDQGTNFTFINDHLATPQYLIDDDLGFSWEADWDSFGVEIATGIIENPFAFPGQYFDQETDLYYNFHRFYSRETGTYMQPDPINRYFKDGIEILTDDYIDYHYVLNNPVIAFDPLGLKAYRCIRPLGDHGPPSDNVRYGPDLWGNPLYHSYYCVTIGGTTKCYGHAGSGMPVGLGSRGRPTTPKDGDVYDPRRCWEIPSNCCFEKCLTNYGNSRRPWYNLQPMIPFAQNCQEWVDEGIQKCKKECKMK